MEQARKRAQNCTAILRALHFAGPLQRSALSERLGIRKSSVGSIVAELLGAGMVAEQRAGSARSPLILEATRHFVAAGSITMDGVRIARVFQDGSVRDLRVLPLKGDTSPTRVISVIAGGLAPLVDRDRAAVLGAGVSMPGLVDPSAGTTRYTAHLEGWRDVPLAEEVARKIGIPVRVDNNVRSQLWASAWFDRLLAEFANLLYVGITDGVACSTIVHGRRVVGGRHAAGEIGHVRVGGEGRLCKCGKADCLETYSSMPAILDEIRKLRPDLRVSGGAELASQSVRDPVIGNVLDRAVERLANVLAPVIAAMDPEVIVLGSEAREFSELVRPMLEHHLRAELLGLEPRTVDLRVGEPEDLASLKGIAGLVIEGRFASGEPPHRGRRARHVSHASTQGA